MDGLTISDIIWDSDYFTETLNNREIVSINNNIEFSDKPSRPSKSLVDIKLYKKLIDIKNKIPDCLQWDKWVKSINPYDKIQSISTTYNDKDYYKYYEIVKYYGLIEDIDKNTNKKNSIHFGKNSQVAVKSFLNFIPKLNWYIEDIGISANISPSSSDAAINISESDLEFYKSKDISNNLRMFESHETFNLLYDFDIITCDISTDSSCDPNNKEQLSFRTFFSHALNGIKLQKIGGFIIFKIFDTITRPTCQLIYYLTNFYEKIDIMKPRTSRYSSSEKFIIASNFKGISHEELEILENMLISWDSNLYCRLTGVDIPESVEKIFYDYNQKLIEKQFIYIEKIFRYNYEDDSSLEKQLSAFQNKKAIEFCKNFNIKSNINDNIVCKHYKKIKISINGIKNCCICSSCYLLVI
jgi:23S rRNA U2552 (ribose-2'-O)-methylase RlmE/FtsJ